MCVRKLHLGSGMEGVFAWVLSERVHCNFCPSRKHSFIILNIRGKICVINATIISDEQEKKCIIEQQQLFSVAKPNDVFESKTNQCDIQ